MDIVEALCNKIKNTCKTIEDINSDIEREEMIDIKKVIDMKGMKIKIKEKKFNEINKMIELLKEVL